jgi:murein DD-endopeptidase MepM/ murein hydrolase activator NlpD
VARGETISGIAARYGTSPAALARLNRLSDPDRIWPGQRLRIGAGSSPARSPRESRPGPSAQGWRWPVEGELSSSFGLRGLRRHRGIDITAPTGTPVLAAASGRVVHSGSARGGYGNLVIVRHGGDTSTVYAHNRRNLVRVGEWVESGQPIAEVGQTGRASGPHLHFEVRRAGRAQNPLDFLP